MSVWSAPVTTGGGTRPTITVTPTSRADTGVAVLEYAGLSTVADATVVDQMAHAAGTTSGACSVASGATAATTAGNELAVGFYADSGFEDTLAPGSGYNQRVKVSNTGDMELLAEDQVLSASGALPNASATTGANTTWLMATVGFKSASPGLATAMIAHARLGLHQRRHSHRANHRRRRARHTHRRHLASTRHAHPHATIRCRPLRHATVRCLSFAPPRGQDHSRRPCAFCL
jgi:hypothetical protein